MTRIVNSRYTFCATILKIPDNKSFSFIYYKSFQAYTGPVNLDERGDRIPMFVISNVVDAELVTRTVYNPLDPRPLPENLTFIFPGDTTVIPLDVPECGFNNEFCIAGKISQHEFLL